MGIIMVRRNPLDYNVVEVQSESLQGAHWSDICGGIQCVMPVTTIYAYMDYDEMRDAGITTSGRHSYGYNSGKICICKCDNTGKDYKEYEEEYYKFVVEADHNQKSRPMNRKRTKTVVDLLKEYKEGLKRKEIMRTLIDEGWRDKDIREAISILNKAGYLHMEGSLRSPNSIISLGEGGLF